MGQFGEHFGANFDLVVTLTPPVEYVFPIYRSSAPEPLIIEKKRQKRYRQTDEFAVPIMIHQRDDITMAATIQQSDSFSLLVISLQAAYETLLAAYEKQTKLVKRLKLMWLSSV